ncbi:MAG: hypothetical protein JKY37_01540 [Nannocystaceae bacterium]|nr:hypothetical protein [Nannocystaceae bacterium]
MRFRLLPGSTPYKSLAPGFDTGHLPDFVVLTGPNGSGKTHLLQLVAEHFRNPTFDKHILGSHDRVISAVIRMSACSSLGTRDLATRATSTRRF